MSRLRLSIKAVLLGSALVLGGVAHAATSVKVMSIVDHPALDATRDGVRDELKAQGLDVGWEFQSAQGNVGTAAQIARKFIGAQPGVIVAIATPSAQAVAAATKNIPLVYAAVTDPVAAQLVKTWGPSGTNVTGVSDQLPLERQIELIKEIVPNARRVGMVYNPGEANSVVVVESMKKLLAQQGMTLVEAPAPRTVDIPSAARSLSGKADVIYTNTDNNVVSAYEALVKAAEEIKLPLVASDVDSVKRGGVAAMGIDYYEHGRATGKIVARILKGEKPGSIPSQTMEKLQLHVNPAAAERQGIKLPEALIKRADFVVK